MFAVRDKIICKVAEKTAYWEDDDNFFLANGYISNNTVYEVLSVVMVDSNDTPRNRSPEILVKIKSRGSVIWARANAFVLHDPLNLPEWF